MIDPITNMDLPPTDEGVERIIGSLQLPVKVKEPEVYIMNKKGQVHIVNLSHFNQHAKKREFKKITAVQYWTIQKMRDPKTKIPKAIAEEIAKKKKPIKKK